MITCLSVKTDRRDDRPWAKIDDGVLVVDKPQGWTSHDVVAKMRYLAKNRKIGHAGTLDPMATGVLVLGIGRATRLLSYIVDAPKEYHATLRLGIATTTEDAEGERTESPGFAHADPAAVEVAAAKFTGTIMQVPSAVSAIKVDGKRAYDLVRQGEDVNLAAREVNISLIDVIEVRTATTDDGIAVVDVDLVVRCSAGTYIRALGRDIAHELGTCGHLTALRRTHIGDFTVEGALGPIPLEEQTKTEGALAVRSIADAISAVLPVRHVTDDEARELSFGRAVTATGKPGTFGALSASGEAVALLEDRRVRGELVAQPVVVLAPAN
ncbi:tRNA pseudouridine55 synthase [Micrococcales bacterium KH10]|nr:tRNA pseudouridine55 synthase [Micrococcales bacterium KH10]